MEKLYRFTWDCGRQGTVRGLFVADDERDIKPALGIDVYFGEILGKHSEISGMLEERDLEALTDDADFIAKARAYNMVPTGYNPLEYITCRDCGEPLPAPYAKCGRESCGWERDP